MELNKSVIVHVLNQLFSCESYQLVYWKVEPFGKVVGYHGSHNILKIGINVHGKENKLSFFLKFASESPELFEKYFKLIRIFDKEHFILTDVINDIQSAVGEKLTAKCYFSELNKLCILEDLNAIGYNEPKDKASNWDHVKMALEKLAALHAGAFIIEEKYGCSLKQKYPQINFETFFNPMDTNAGTVFKSTYMMFVHILNNKIKGIPTDRKLAFQNWLHDNVLSISNLGGDFRNVICHGDPWYMNFMYKYNEANEVEDVLMVDFQASRIAPPAIDIQQFLCLTYTDDQRKANSSALIDVYYKRLTQCLEKSELNVGSILPREILEKSLKQYLKMGLCMKVTYTVLTRLPQSFLQTLDSPDKIIKLMTEGDFELCSAAFDQDQEYREWCNDSIFGAYNYFSETTYKV